MKEALILENEYAVDSLVNWFLQDFDMFDKQTPLVGIIHLSFKTIANYINEDTCLVFNSTFMYKNQLEEFTDKLAKYKYPLEIYIGRLLIHIEDWVDSPSFLWEDRGKFFANFHTCFNKHKIYSFEEDYEGRRKDDRYPMKYGKVHFNSVDKTVEVKRWNRAK